jgi:hypothetical protein
LTPSPVTATKGERKKENGKCERKETDGEKRRGNKDVEEKTDLQRKKEIEKGKKHKDTQNDIEKRGENEDVNKKIDDERIKKENVKGKKKKKTTPENMEGKTDGPGLVRPKDSSSVSWPSPFTHIENCLHPFMKKLSFLSLLCFYYLIVEGAATASPVRHIRRHLNKPRHNLLLPSHETCMKFVKIRIYLI